MAEEAQSGEATPIEQVIADISHTIGRINTALDKNPAETIQELLANLQGGEEGKGNLNLMGLLSLLGGLNGQEEDENPLTALFASTYEKYLNGNGEDVAGLIPTYQQLLIEAGGALMFTATLKPALGTAPAWALMG